MYVCVCVVWGGVGGLGRGFRSQPYLCCNFLIYTSSTPVHLPYIRTPSLLLRHLGNSLYRNIDNNLEERSTKCTVAPSHTPSPPSPPPIKCPTLPNGFNYNLQHTHKSFILANFSYLYKTNVVKMTEMKAKYLFIPI